MAKAKNKPNISHISPSPANQVPPAAKPAPIPDWRDLTNLTANELAEVCGCSYRHIIGVLLFKRRPSYELMNYINGASSKLYRALHQHWIVDNNLPPTSRKINRAGK